MKKLFILIILIYGSLTATEEESRLNKPIILYETFDNNQSNVGVKGDLLYMHYSSPFISYACEVTQHGTVYENGRIFAAKGKTRLGYDVALNYTMHWEPKFTFQLEWFHITPQFKRTVTSDHLLPSHISILTTYTPGTGTNNSQIRINLIDFCISKKFTFGKSFSLAPLIGAVGGLMKSYDKSHFIATSGSFGTGATIVDFNEYANYKGIGGKVGLEYSLKIIDGFKIAGHLNYNILYGFTNMSFFVTSNGTSITSAKDRYFHHHGRTFLDALLGLAWQRNFNHEKLFLDLRAGWRVQDFFEGIMQYEAVYNDAVQPRALFGHGLETGVTFKF